MNNALVKDDHDSLFLTECEWHSDYGAKKYRFIHLAINNGLEGMSLSVVDVFMLASSRLSTQGELVVRFEKECKKNHSDFLALANSFDFECLTNTDKALYQYVFRFKGKETKPGYLMAQASAHIESCVALFKESFGSAISEKFWTWKYPRQKYVNSVVALKNNKAVAHYGLCDRRAYYNEGVFSFSQASDVMVSPGERGAIASSVFYELVSLGEKPFYRKSSPISVIYGFPHGRHYKLGARLKLYSPISSIMDIAFKVPTEVTSNDTPCTLVYGRSSGLPSESSVINKAVVTSVVCDMISATDVVVLERDYEYLLQRYIHHPEFEYEVYYFRNCYFIIKVNADSLLLMDYWGDLAGYVENLHAFIPKLASSFPGYSLHLWCLENIASSFIDAVSINNTGAFFVCKTYASDLPDFKQWWITMGDTEFL